MKTLCVVVIVASLFMIFVVSKQPQEPPAPVQHRAPNYEGYVYVPPRPEPPEIPKATLLSHSLSYSGPTVAYGISRVGGVVTNNTYGPLSVSIEYALYSDYNQSGSVLGTESDYISTLPGYTAWEFLVTIYKPGVKSVKLVDLRVR